MLYCILLFHCRGRDIFRINFKALESNALSNLLSLIPDAQLYDLTCLTNKIKIFPNDHNIQLYPKIMYSRYSIPDLARYLKKQVHSLTTHRPASTSHSMLDHRLRWPNIESTLGQRIMFAGDIYTF